MAVLDTNILVRHLTVDDVDMAKRASRLLDSVASGERAVLLTEAVLVETVQVLSSRALYHLSRETIRAYLTAVFAMEGVILSNRSVYLRTLETYAETPTLSFVDSMLVAYAELEEAPTVISFDRDFRRVASITWQEP